MFVFLIIQSVTDDGLMFGENSQLVCGTRKLVLNQSIYNICRQRGPWGEHVLPPLQNMDLPQPEDPSRTHRGVPGSGGGGGGGSVLRLTLQRGTVNVVNS